MKRFCLLCLLLSLAPSCHKNKDAEGPIERAGKKVDKAAEKTGQALGTAAEKTGEALEKAGSKLQGDEPPAKERPKPSE